MLDGGSRDSNWGRSCFSYEQISCLKPNGLFSFFYTLLPLRKKAVGLVCNRLACLESVCSYCVLVGKIEKCIHINLWFICLHCIHCIGRQPLPLPCLYNDTPLCDPPQSHSRKLPDRLLAWPTTQCL